MSRRGSITGNKSAGYSFVVDVPSSSGGRRQLRRRGFRTKSAAQHAITEVLADMQRGAFVHPTSMTLGSWLEVWLVGLRTAGRQPTTLSSYQRTLHSYVVPRIGHLTLQKLTAADLDKMYGSLLREGGRRGGQLSPRTVRYTATLVQKALGDAERKGLVTRNVARLADPPSSSAARAPEAKVWTPTELRGFMDAHREHRHFPLVRLAAMTGMRRGELCGLRWLSVDLEAATARVTETITTVDHQPFAKPVKTNRSRRVLDLDSPTIGVLRRWRREQLEQRLLMGEGWQDTGLVFTMPDGRGWHPDVISRAWARLVRADDFVPIRFHDLRHTHASHLLAAGVNVKVVSERLGHASVAFTLDQYAHVMPGQQADAAAAVSALVDL
jgi:integrase